MKRMTKKEFLEGYMYGLKNFIMHGQTKYYKNEIEFRPAHSLFDFKMSYKFPCIFFYNKKKDATYLFFYCCGIINIEWCSDDYEGIMMKFKGDRTESILEDLLKSKKFENLIAEEYDKYDKEFREKYSSTNEEDKEESEEVHKTFENFEEELKKVEESMGA